MEPLDPFRLLVVRTERTGRHYVAVDTHGAVPGELVVTTSAAAARMCEQLEGIPVDLCVVAVPRRCGGAGGMILVPGARAMRSRRGRTPKLEGAKLLVVVEAEPDGAERASCTLSPTRSAPAKATRCWS